MTTPRPPRCCDLCGAAVAPFGYRVPGAGRRALQACAPCRPAAEIRFQAAQALRDPVRSCTPRPALPVPPPRSRTPDLFA